MTNIRLRYQTLEFGEIDIHVCTLRDKQQFQDADGIAEGLGISSASWAYFGVIWPSGLILAQFISAYNTAAKRILEVGCGIGLPSLLLNAKCADITATDYHPEVETFLNRNTSLNNDTTIEFERANWADTNDQLGAFDLIIGSDLLYEDEHSKLLANFINKHAKPSCEILLVDPGRGRKAKMTTRMAEFGFKVSYQKIPQQAESDIDFKGYILKFDR